MQWKGSVLLNADGGCSLASLETFRRSVHGEASLAAAMDWPDSSWNVSVGGIVVPSAEDTLHRRHRHRQQTQQLMVGT